jgi:hypothetical protein
LGRGNRKRKTGATYTTVTVTVMVLATLDTPTHASIPEKCGIVLRTE